MADRSGQQLGNYRLLRLLGRGGFAEVYLGQHIYLGSQAALKVLSLVLTDEDTGQFAKEARTLASLNHPHIIRVLEFAIENNTPFLVMEYATNGTLRQLHPQGSRLPTETVITYIRQIASALQYAHDQHLIHRDVKPENMLLGSNGEILLSDFGLATLALRPAENSTQAMEPSIVGTTSYSAPEQLQGRPQSASDQYSLGIVVYEWLSGKRPFNGSAFEIAMQHISTPPPPLHAQMPGISPAVEEVVMQVLAKEPLQRFASVQDFASALQRAYQYTLLPRSFFAPSEEADALQTILKPGPMWKVPTIFTPLIGRENEVAEICALLKEPTVRLLTLLGTGGIGKTRVSFQLAREIQPYFADGICFVPLASVNQPAMVIPTIAREFGIQRIGTQPIFEQLKVALRNRHLLLVLDNFEQVVAAAPLIEELLAACPRLKVVVTSRAVLHLAAEHEFPVPPLDLPNLNQLPEDETLSQYAAIALFVQRAKAILPKFRVTQDNARAIAEICVRLDGLPLAIELAAGHIKLLPPHLLLAQLPQLFQSSSGTSRTLPPRHQTLHNALQWSYDLLDGQEQQLFRRLSIFIGGWTLEAVEAMETMLNTGGYHNQTLSTLDRVGSLLDKSLLIQRVEEGQEPRLQMLMTVRVYALELLRESGEMEQSQRAHALYFLTLVEEAEAQLKGPQQTTWLARLEVEQENMRVALTWLIEQRENELALRLCAALWWFWHLRGYWSEGRRWLKTTLELAQGQEPTLAHARALCAAGDLAYYQDDYGAARPLLEESITLCRKLDIKRELATALGALGILLDVQGDHATARPLLEESERLCRTVGTRWELAYLLSKLGQRAVQEGDLTKAAGLTHEALRLAQELGDKSLIATVFSSLASLVALQGDQTQAMAYDRQCLRLARELGDKYLTALTLQNLGYTAALQGDMAQAVARAQEGLVLARELGDKLTINLALHSLGYIASLQGNTKQAAVSYREGLSLAQEIGYENRIGWHLVGLATVAAAEDEPVRAARLFGAASTRLDVNVSMNDMERADYERTVEAVRNKLDHRTFQAAWTEGHTMTPEQALTAPEPLPMEPVPARINPPPPTPVYPDGLTVREVEVLRFLASGQTVAQIALQLVVSPRTVSTHITSIYRKI